MTEDKNLLLIDSEADRGLVDQLNQLTHRPVPDEFLTRATEHFEQARARRLWRRTAAFILGGMLFSTPALWLAILNYKLVAKALAATLSATGALLDVTWTIWSGAPVMAMTAMIGLMCAVLLPSAMLMRLSRTGTPVEIKASGARI